MKRDRSTFHAFMVSIIIVLIAGWGNLLQIAYAFHFPWDQGHDTFTGNPGDGGTDPGPGGQ